MEGRIPEDSLLGRLKQVAHYRTSAVLEQVHCRHQMVTNVKAVHLQIASLLGEPILKFYTFDVNTIKE